MIDLKEKDIIADWCNLEQPLVSVLCITFNHFAFIAQALDSFLMQRTDFPFEIIVHDDVSTDGTKDIIHEYEVNYPNIIKPIYETENQYSKKDGSLERVVFGACKGRYVAFCEGDDYWTDCNKLQKQFDFLESHHEYVACVHNTFVIEMDGKLKNHVMYPTKDIVLTMDNLKERYHASSLMCKSRACLDLPSFFSTSLAPGDVKLAACLRLKGPIFRFAETMSAYRHGTPGSWTKTHIKHKRDFSNRLNVIKFYQDFNKWTAFKYNSVSDRIDQLTFDMLLNQGLLFKAKYRYPKLFRKLNIRQKIKYGITALTQFMS